jgi:hypothetical protein
MRMIKRWFVLSLILLAASAGCGGLAEMLPAEDGGAENGVGDGRAEELVYDGPDPVAGTGNVYGQIKWNSAGVAGIELVLCTDYSSFSGCSGESFRTETDDEGYFTFVDVEPDTYAMLMRVFDTDEWLYMGSGLFSTADFEVAAGETLLVGVQNIFKLDLSATYPASAAAVSETEFLLEWAAYPDAAYYKIYLTPEEGAAVFVDKRVDENSLSVALLPVNCAYRWQLEAFNADRIKIAESGDYFTFEVTDQEADCVIQLTEPLDGSQVSGEDIILDWEPNPLAVRYEILMWNDDDGSDDNVLDFVEVAESGYSFDFTLAPGRHVWSVRAFNEVGDEIAGSEIFDFTVVE